MYFTNYFSLILSPKDRNAATALSSRALRADFEIVKAKSRLIYFLDLCAFYRSAVINFFSRTGWQTYPVKAGYIFFIWVTVPDLSKDTSGFDSTKTNVEDSKISRRDEMRGVL